jgi:hypothetical protein
MTIGAVDGTGGKQSEGANASLLDKIGSFKSLMAKKPAGAKANDA